MDVTSKTLREVEFREKMRGYHPEDVDQFLEQAAEAFEALQDRVRQAVERAQRAEAAAADAGGSDETLRRTLVLAQRTADLAVQEAREQAARILSGAEQQAQAMLADAEAHARRLEEDSLNETRAELAKLEATRAQTQQEVDILARWVEEHRSHLTSALQDALAMVERASLLSAAPMSSPLDLGGGGRQTPRQQPSSQMPSSESPTQVEDLGSSEGSSDETVVWDPAQAPTVQKGGGSARGDFRDSNPRDPNPRDPNLRDPEGEGAGPQGAAGRAAMAPGETAGTPGRAAYFPQVHKPVEGGAARTTYTPGGSDATSRDATSRGATSRDATSRDATIRLDSEDPGSPEHSGGAYASGANGTNPTATMARNIAAPSPDDQALDDFFDDPSFADDRRFGGRLRRRR